MPLIKWLIASVIGGILGYLISHYVIDAVRIALDVEYLLITKFLVFFMTAFCGLLGAAIVNGFSGKGFKVMLE